MHRTYELYVRDEGGRGHFEIVACEDEAIMEQVERILAEPGVQEVDVRQAGEVIFTVAK